MKKTAQKVANALSEIYDDNFANYEFVEYRLSWNDLRLLAGGHKLNGEFIAEINETLEESQQVLVPFGNFLAVLSEEDCSCLRELNGRLLEKYLSDEDVENAASEDDDDVEIEDDEA